MDLYTTVSPLLLLLLLLGLCGAQLDNSSGDQSGDEDISTTILRMNSGFSDFLMEGDLLPPKTRTAMKCLNDANSCLWPKSANGKVEIKYTISNKYDRSERNAIIRAMRDFESQTCIRFIPRKRGERIYLSIEPRYGCFSMLGRIGDRQVVSLQRFGCIDHGIIQHELMHAIGFHHEHTRSDRDQYVKIHWENLDDYVKNNFHKKDTNNLNLPYDYSSIMHYGRTAFGRFGSQTITPIPDPSVPIGQRAAMSEVDILRVNLLYKCHLRDD
ncbi:low choriolytic enzyme-like [Stegastes partitus]|uniref:Metalloendopeptidase n=1 Tax=Stegastes partitus TaxID=144197 RepID=A0A9Y4N1B1_9TELE|nr:PREDICTED: low choriolytic enzyme-like [Stegastes partitus]